MPIQPKDEKYLTPLEPEEEKYCFPFASEDENNSLLFDSEEEDVDEEFGSEKKNANEARQEGIKVGNEEGYVQGVLTYVVMDDLVVMPMSSVMNFAFNKFNIKDFGSLDEMVVELGMTEGINSQRASLQTNMVLKQRFLGKNGA